MLIYSRSVLFFAFRRMGQYADHVASLPSVLRDESGLPVRDISPISPPTIISSTGKDGRKYRDAMAVIAESHITIHADEDGRYFFDIFSCKAFDTEAFMRWADTFGLSIDPSTVTLAMRGRDFPRLHTARAKFLDVLKRMAGNAIAS